MMKGLDRTETIGVLSMLRDVMMISGEMDEKEKAWLWKVSEKLNLPADITQKVLDGELSSEAPIKKKEHERIPIFYLCTIGNSANGEFGEKEEAYCTRLGFRLGIRPIIMEQIMESVKAHYPNPVPVKEITRIVKIAHN